MKEYTRAEVSLDLGVLGELRLTTLYSVTTAPEALSDLPQDVEVDVYQILLQVEGKLFNILPIIPDDELATIVDSLINLEVEESEEIEEESVESANDLVSQMIHTDVTEEESRS